MDKSGRLENTFKKLKENGEKALITFITAGDPDIPTTRDIILALEKSGADIIELGIPFSDPMADGPTIQASSERAVGRGVHLSDVIALVGDIRNETEVPIVLFGYYNPIFNYGLAKFARQASKAGVDGVLIVDLPAEESDELKDELDKKGIDLIFLLTPTSDEGRIKLMSKKGSGFLYFVSVTGVTGARAAVAGDVRKNVAKVRKHTALPVGVGFGISSAKQAKEVCSYSDGVIVGSAIVSLIAKHSGSKSLIKEVSAFVKSLKDGIRRA